MVDQVNRWCLWRARQLRGDGDVTAAAEWEERAAVRIDPDPAFAWPTGMTRQSALEMVRLDAAPDLPDDASDDWIAGSLAALGDTDGKDESYDDELEELEAQGEDDDVWDLDDEAGRQDAQGYNPNRSSNGQFAAGAHKARPNKPRVARAPSAAKFDDKSHRATIGGHRAEELKHRQAVVRLKEEQVRLRAAAKQVPTKERVKIREAHAELGRQREASRSLANAAKERRVTASKEMADARREHVDGNRARRLAVHDARRHVVATTPLDHDDLGEVLSNGKLHNVQFSQKAQSAIREHHNAVLGQYGLHDRDAGLHAAKIIEIRTDRGMGAWGNGVNGAAGLHWQHDGRVAFDVERGQGLHEHMKLRPEGLALAGSHYGKDKSSDDVVFAYHASTHEAAHGHGPTLVRVGSHNMVEELSTEMVARRVVADVHGIPLHEVNGEYRKYIDPTVSKLQALSGRTRPEAMAALASASLKFKRGSARGVNPDDAMLDIGTNSLRRLGVTDLKSRQELYLHMAAVSAGDP